MKSNNFPWYPTLRFPDAVYAFISLLSSFSPYLAQPCSEGPVSTLLFTFTFSDKLGHCFLLVWFNSLFKMRRNWHRTLVVEAHNPESSDVYLESYFWKQVQLTLGDGTQVRTESPGCETLGSTSFVGFLPWTLLSSCRKMDSFAQPCASATMLICWDQLIMDRNIWNYKPNKLYNFQVFFY